jgi:hypothetical protein
MDREMNEQELQEEAGILDKACRQIGAELTAGGLAALSSSANALRVMHSKLERLEKAKAEQVAKQAEMPEPSAHAAR